MHLLKLATAGLFAVFGIAVGALWVTSGELVAPARANIGAPPSWLGAESVEFGTSSGSTVHGWLARPKSPTATVVLLHAVRGSRRAMLGRARFLGESGLSVLLIDFQAHGESDGEKITFGHLESRDAAAAVRFARNTNPNLPIIVIGTSLGGAAALLAEPKLEIDGLVIEAVYPTIEIAVRNRLRSRAGWLGGALSPLLLAQLRPRMDLSPKALSPMDRARHITAPVFVISGEEDRRTTAQDTKMLYDSFTGPKQLWLIPGAGHQDLHGFAGDEYEVRMLHFIDQVVSGAI